MTAKQTQTASAPPTVTRRTFLGRTGILTAGLTGAAQSLNRAAGQPAPQAGKQDTVVLGVIGCGRRGRKLIEAASRVPGLTVGMVCDVAPQRYGAAADLVEKLFGGRPAVTSEYRDVLDVPAVSAVIIATPDHWHATQTLNACAAGKDIYLESPPSLYPAEAKAMTYAVRKYKRIAQVGLQLRSSSRFTEAAGILRSGNLGRIAQTRSWTFTRQEPMPPQPEASPPPGLDYDRWLGPAAERPFDAARFAHPERFWDYGGGEAAIWSMHFQDLVQAAMRVNVPKSVVAVGGNFGLDDGRETPDTLDVLFEFESAGGSFVQAYSLRLSNAYAGWGPAALPAVQAHAGSLPARSGVQFFGSEKTLFVGQHRLLLLPAGQESPMEDLAFLDIGSRGTESPPADPTDPLTIAHLEDFASCVRSRDEPSATIETGQWAMFPCLAANIAYRVGRKLYIKPDALEFFLDPDFKQKDEQANELSFTPYRETYPPPKV